MRPPPTVGEVMTKEVVSVAGEMKVRDALRLMQRHDIGTLVVLGRTPRVLESSRIKPADLDKQVRDLPLPPCRVVAPNTPLDEVHRDILETSLVAVAYPGKPDLMGVVTAFDVAK